ncbi:hypothetical protein J6590_084428 [Homalodisca vitripennis]|nr:hypothetical protein J6590_084428 [Homalodisca vitripennis]
MSQSVELFVYDSGGVMETRIPYNGHPLYSERMECVNDPLHSNFRFVQHQKADTATDDSGIRELAYVRLEGSEKSRRRRRSKQTQFIVSIIQRLRQQESGLMSQGLRQCQF